MSAPSKPGQRARLPWGFLGAVGLAVLAECWVVRHRLDLTPSGAAGFRFAAGACREATGCDYLCLGDSLVKNGVIPRVLEARLGKRVWNLGCVGGTAPLTYMLLKRSLDAGGRPVALLVDFCPVGLQSRPENIERALAEIIRPGESYDLARVARDPWMFSRLLASRALPSLRARSEVRGWVLAAVRGESNSLGPVNRVLTRNWSVNRGAGLLEKIPGSELVSAHFDERGNTHPARWYCHPVNAVYLRRFLDLASARGIPVVWLVPPIHPRVQARRDLLGLDAGFDRLLRNATKQYPNLTVIEGRRSGYPARHFVDSSHLDSDGAYAYTDDLATLLTRPPGGTRWVALPPYRDRPRVIPLEDQGGSRVALFGGDRVRR